MGSDGDRRIQRVEQVTIAVVAHIVKLRAAVSLIDGAHDCRDRLMGREGQKRIIRLALAILSELGYEHKTDRAVRRAIKFKLEGAGIGFVDTGIED